VDDKSVKNAFVLPGGKIFVFTGILPVSANDDGLATVLGHEIAHQGELATIYSSIVRAPNSLFSGQTSRRTYELDEGQSETLGSYCRNLRHCG
jgi:hypothetical protein